MTRVESKPGKKKAAASEDGGAGEYPRRIDKSQVLEERLEEFPILYLEAAAAAGKTTALNFLLEKHPDQRWVWLDMAWECKRPKELQGKVEDLTRQVREEPLWMVWDHMPPRLAAELVPAMTELLEVAAESTTEEERTTIPGNGAGDGARDTRTQSRRVLFLSREKPEGWLLPFLWKEKLGMVSHKDLLLSREEVRQMAGYYGRLPEADALWNLSGGWGGCVSMALRLAVRPELAEAPVSYIWQTYEMEEYIRREMRGSLSEEENKILDLAGCCPWVREDLCHDLLNQAWGKKSDLNPDLFRSLLEDLTRKGFLQCDYAGGRWRLAPLFRSGGRNKKRGENETISKTFRQCGQWYQTQGYVREALECLSRGGNEEGYRQCMLRYYRKIPFLGLDYSPVLSWQEDQPEIHYLKGMWLRSLQDFRGLDGEIAWLEDLLRKTEMQEGETSSGAACQEGSGSSDSASGQRIREIVLNLTFAAPGISLEEWLSLASRLSGQSDKNHPYELYSIMGNSFTFLCGLRDLTGLFACGKREEKRKAQIWKTCLGPREYLAYRLARMDYLLETDQIHALTEEDRSLLRDIETGTKPEEEDRALTLMGFYLICKAQQRNIWGNGKEEARTLERKLLECDHPIYRENARALAGMYAPYFGETARLAEWIRSMEAHQPVTEATYGRILLVCAGFIKYQRPENIRKLLEDLLDHLQAFHYQRLLAEALFLRALLAWEEGSGGRSTMLKAVIQAFLVGGSGHYIRFYTSYGSRGQELLEAYREWSRNTSPERWKRKKRYHYASPAQMPEEDYLDLLIRQAGRHSQRENRAAAEEIPERLTAMETVVLQAMSRGLSNGEICEELSLKLPTVKSHIYSIYKKLGVNSRVQAILRGKERRILQQ